MTRPRAFLSPFATILFLVAVQVAPAAPAPEAKSPLEQVPASAPLVIHLNGVERTKDRVIALVENALPDQSTLVAVALNGAFNNGIDGRKLEGIPKDGHVFLVYLEMPRDTENAPKAALVVAVNDYAKFRDGLLKDDERKALKVDKEAGYESTVVATGDPLFFLDKKGYAVIALTKEVAETFAKPYKGLDGKISKELGSKLLAHDAGVYLSADVFNKEYADQIKMAKDFVNGPFMQQIETVGTLNKDQIALIKNVADTTFQAVEDSQGLLATIDFRPTGLAFHVETELRANTHTAGLLKDSKPVAFGDLAKLPAGQMYYTAMKLSPSVLKTLGPLAFSVAGETDGKAAKEIRAAVDDLIKAGPQERLDTIAFPMAMVQVSKFKDGAKAVEAQLRLQEALPPGTSYQSVILKEKAVVKRKDQKYRDFDMAAVRMVPDVEALIEKSDPMGNLPAAAKKDLVDLYKKMVGETVNSWVGTDGKAVYTVAAADWKSAQKALDEYFGGKEVVGGEPGYKLARKELPAEATVYALLDPMAFGSFMAEFIKVGIAAAGPGLPVPANWPALPAKHKSSYVGLAVTLQPGRGGLDLFFSADAVNETYKAFVKPFMVGGVPF